MRGTVKILCNCGRETFVFLFLRWLVFHFHFETNILMLHGDDNKMLYVLHVQRRFPKIETRDKGKVEGGGGAALT